MLDRQWFGSIAIDEPGTPGIGHADTLGTDRSAVTHGFQSRGSKLKGFGRATASFPKSG